MAQLFLLKAALVNSTKNPIYYKELANKLRLLIYEREGSRSYKPLLLILAENYNVTHKVTFRYRWPSSNESLNDPSDFKTVEFREYLTEMAFGREDKLISGSQLIADVANQIGGSHEDLDHAEYLRPASAPINGIPYMLEILQGIAKNTLAFGSKVVDQAVAILGSYPTAEDLNGEPIAPLPSCEKCQSILGYAAFTCPNCGTPLFQYREEPPLVEKFRTTLKAAGCAAAECAMLVGWYSIPDLFNKSAGHGILLDYVEGDVNFKLDRTADFQLVFSHTQKNKTLSVAVDLTPVPPIDWVMLVLTWSPSSVGLYVGSNEQVFSNEFKEEQNETLPGNY